MKGILKLTFALGIVCLLGGAALAWVNQVTLQPRRQAEDASLQASLQLVLPGETARTERLQEEFQGDFQFFRAFNAQGEAIASAALGTGPVKGFGGPVKILAGFTPDGKILNVLVVSHQETPGLGTRATDRTEQHSLWEVLSGKAKKNAFPPNPFLDQFRNAAPGEISLGANGMHGVTGATYSSRAVTSGIQAATQIWQRLHLQNKI